MMDLSLASLIAETQLTLRDPRNAARRMMALNLPMAARWLALGIMSIGSAMLTHVSLALIPLGDRDPVIDFMSNPITTALLQGVTLVVLVGVVFWVGRLRGGKGSFADALVVMTWLQFVMLCLQLVQLLVLLALPPVAGLVNLAAFALFLWLLTNFVAELHGFRSLITVFGGIILSIIAVGFLISLLLVMLGYGQGMGV